VDELVAAALDHQPSASQTSSSSFTSPPWAVSEPTRKRLSELGCYTWRAARRRKFIGFTPRCMARHSPTNAVGTVQRRTLGSDGGRRRTRSCGSCRCVRWPATRRGIRPTQHRDVWFLSMELRSIR
jgi:hypothetical protein